MSLRDIYLGLKLSFDTPQDQEDSEDLIMRLLGMVSRYNLAYLRKHPSTPLLYEANVVYAPPDQADGRPPLDRDKVCQILSIMRSMGQEPETALMVIRLLRGMEIFLDIPALLRRGKGDCNELTPWRIAELWRAQIMASPYITFALNASGGRSYHNLVLWPDRSSEDPSLILGMGGEANRDLRREEIRKNAERWSNYMRAAKQLIVAEGADASQLGTQIDMMGLAPRSGVFKSPYGRVTSAHSDVGYVRRAA